MLALYAGDGATLRITVTDPASVPLDLTGAVTAQIRTTPDAATAKADFAADLSLHASGVVLLSLTGIQTAALLNGTGAPFKGVYDVQWRPTGGQPITLVQGEVTCELDVTRP